MLATDRFGRIKGWWKKERESQKHLQQLSLYQVKQNEYILYQRERLQLEITVLKTNKYLSRNAIEDVRCRAEFKFNRLGIMPMRMRDSPFLWVREIIGDRRIQ